MDGLEALRLSVPTWTDAQLRDAWKLSATQLHESDPAALDKATQVRRLLLEEWERRHPRERVEWERLLDEEP